MATAQSPDPLMRTALNKTWQDQIKSWIDFRSFMRQRRLILSNPEQWVKDRSSENKDWKSPQDFAWQGLALTTVLLNLTGGALSLFNHTPHHIITDDPIWQKTRALLFPLTVIFSAYMLKLMLRFGKDNPTQYLEEAPSIYLYHVSACAFWPNVFQSVAAAMLLYFGPIDATKASVEDVVFFVFGSLYIILGIRAIKKVSVVLRTLFGMHKPLKKYNSYTGENKIQTDILVANIVVLAALSGLCFLASNTAHYAQSHIQALKHNFTR